MLPPAGAEGSTKVIVREIKRRYGICVAGLQPLATIKHGVTRFRITLDCFTATAESRETIGGRQQSRWLRPADLDQLALSMTARKISRMLLEQETFRTNGKLAAAR